MFPVANSDVPDCTFLKGDSIDSSDRNTRTTSLAHNINSLEQEVHSLEGRVSLIDEDQTKALLEDFERGKSERLGMIRNLKEESLRIEEEKNAEFEIRKAAYLETLSDSVVSKSDEKETVEEACKARSGHLWDCVGRKAGEFGGYTYLLEAKDEYNNLSPRPNLAEIEMRVKEKRVELSPAVEASARQFIGHLNIERRIELLLQMEVEEHTTRIREFTQNSDYPLPFENALEIFRIETELEFREFKFREMNSNDRSEARDQKRLGYRTSEENGKILMELPDREALMGAWQALRAIYPERNLPSLSIASSEGIADDLSYTEAHFTHNFLLSTGIEFVHDHQFHVLSQLQNMLLGKDAYEERKARVNQLIFSVYRTVHIAKQKGPEDLKQRSGQLDLIPAVLTDFIYSLPSPSQEKVGASFIESVIKKFGTDEEGERLFLERRFPNIKPGAIEETWKEAQQVEKNIWESRKAQISSKVSLID